MGIGNCRRTRPSTPSLTSASCCRRAGAKYRRKVKAGQGLGRRVGFPRFKRRKHEQGFRADNGPDTVRVDGSEVIMPKIGRVTMVEGLRFGGSIREVTVNRTAGTWFACFCIEDGQPVLPVKDGPTVGVDVGVGITAVCSDGRMVENPKALAPALRRLRRQDKAIARSRKVHGKSNHSNRRERLIPVPHSLTIVVQSRNMNAWSTCQAARPQSGSDSTLKP